ncbi:MAG: glycine C-acetyltransferase [Pseudomonadota bacterium]
MASAFLAHLDDALAELESAGLLKRERALSSPQSARVTLDGHAPDRQWINLCSNNYLGLADHPALIDAAREALDTAGYGMASVRFICGTQTLHRTLEAALADYLDQDDAILFAACFDANGGLFEALLGPEDAVVSDALNHASIIDGIRLCKASRYRYANGDLNALEDVLKRARADGARHVLIASDGVFSMDGTIAELAAVRALADRYDAQLMVDDCHATGIIGARGAGTPSHCGVAADILTGTLGKALGGALGGYVAGPGAVIDTLRQRARPYLFSNALPPAITAAGIAGVALAASADDRRAQLHAHAARWRRGLVEHGFDVLPGDHPIVPVMLGDATLAQQMAAELDARGVFVSAFFHPVVPHGQARIRTQMSAALSEADLDQALDAFVEAGRAVGAVA